MALERKKTLNVFKERHNAWGSFDEYPIGPPGTDPMPHLSRNRVAQPFFLVSDEDQVLLQMAGEGELELRDGEATSMTLSPGDAVYIPARVPSRVVPRGENLQIRLMAEPRAREAVAWYCRCGAIVHARELGPGIPQAEYLRAVEAFNADAALRRCEQCQTMHPTVDLGDIAWSEVAAAIGAEIDEAR
jgi:3-hydroxyanthranilate 3,4-dioxygenase